MIEGSSIEHRAEALDTLAAILPIDRRDRLTELLTEQDVETLRHLAKQGIGENRRHGNDQHGHPEMASA